MGIIKFWRISWKLLIRGKLAITCSISIWSWTISRRILMSIFRKMLGSSILLPSFRISRLWFCSLRRYCRIIRGRTMREDMWGWMGKLKIWVLRNSTITSFKICILLLHLIRKIMCLMIAWRRIILRRKLWRRALLKCWSPRLIRLARFPLRRVRGVVSTGLSKRKMRNRWGSLWRKYLLSQIKLWKMKIKTIFTAERPFLRCMKNLRFIARTYQDHKNQQLRWNPLHSWQPEGQIRNNCWKIYNT